MILNRNAVIQWNNRNQAARDEYARFPIISRAKCEECGVLSTTQICDRCLRGELRYTRADGGVMRCKCGRRTWAESGVCRRCQVGEVA